MALERIPVDSDAWSSSHADHLSRYLFAIQFVAGKRVLDAGTGHGYGAFLLAQNCAEEVVAVDIDHATIQSAKDRFSADRLTYVQDDCELLAGISGRFDVICNFENIEHLQHPDRFLQRATKMLSSDGLLLCSSPDLDGPYHKHANGRTVNDYHVNEWPRQEFLQLLLKYFAKVDMRMQIQSLSCRERQVATNNLNAHLSYLWSTPSARLTRGIRKLLGHPLEWPDVGGVGIGSPLDYPVVDSQVASLFGVPYCHYAICSEPQEVND